MMKNAPDPSSLCTVAMKFFACLLALVSIHAAAQSAPLEDADVNIRDPGLPAAYAANLDGPATYQRRDLSTTAWDESFDELTPPLLPPHWESIAWFTTQEAPASTPNAAFTDDPDFITDKPLILPPVRLRGHARLRFRHQMDLESGAPGAAAFDAVVLEVKVSPDSNVPYYDILDSGATFAEGGYDHTVSSQYGNPLAGRQAWSGTILGYRDVTVDFPPLPAACTVTVFLRWRMGADQSVSKTGYWLDDLHLDMVPSDDEYIFADGLDLCPDQAVAP